MDTLEAIKKRRSIRRFTPDSLPRPLLEQLIMAASLAPTAHNLQPWEFVVITDSELRRQLADLTDYGKFIADSPCCIAVFSQPTKYYLEDCCAATQNILLAATSLGLGTCWVAGDKKPYLQQVQHLLNAPEHLRLVSLIAVGFPAAQPPMPPKNPIGKLIHWERFS